jgi:pantoate--beta-alanine ligase
MKIIHRVEEFIDYRKSVGSSKIVGFVPTMGYLHEGHTSLFDIARKKCDSLIVSIFVNPIQFAPNEDFAAYPRDLERDAKLCESAGVDVIFNPSADMIYPPYFDSYIEVEGEIDKILCAKFRPGHFKGVATVVGKLFNIVRPDFAVFGQKDAQQLAIIRKFVADLNFQIEIIAGATVREPDGLAKSSRNTYLSTRQRALAPEIYRALKSADSACKCGETSANKLKSIVIDHLNHFQDIEVQYVELVDYDTFTTIDTVNAKSLLAIAVYIGKVRLIDNIILEV